MVVFSIELVSFQWMTLHSKTTCSDFAPARGRCVATKKKKSLVELRPELLSLGVGGEGGRDVFRSLVLLRSSMMSHDVDTKASIRNPIRVRL